jgi:hypothetical protein
VTNVHTYIEMSPPWPLPNGDIGGDRQLGESWGRRFRREQPTADGDHPMVNVSFYVEAGDFGAGESTAMMREVEYMLCRNPNDPGATETWSDTRYDQVGFEGTPTDSFARELCLAFDPATITWDGEPLTGTRSHPVRDNTDSHALIIASWNEATQTWWVQARPSANVAWEARKGDASQLMDLLADAGGVVTGG